MEVSKLSLFSTLKLNRSLTNISSLFFSLGTGRYFRRIATGSGLEFTYVDMRDPGIVKSALKPNTKMVFIETPSNPLMRLVDIEKVAKIAHEANPEILVVVDNTFMTPYFQVCDVYLLVRYYVFFYFLFNISFNSGPLISVLILHWPL